MKKYLIFGKEDTIVPVNLLSAEASEEIDALMAEGFSVLSDSCEAENTQEAINTWEKQLKEKNEYEFILTSSTNSISNNHIITSNKGVITSTVVAGTNFLRDILAGVRDVVGGQSETYINKIDAIKSDALFGLRKKAHEKSCNAVIGVSIDIDEISGGGKSMFMVTAVGTAVVAEIKHT